MFAQKCLYLISHFGVEHHFTGVIARRRQIFIQPPGDFPQFITLLKRELPRCLAGLQGCMPSQHLFGTRVTQVRKIEKHGENLVRATL